MIVKISSIDEINKIIRNKLIELSGLEGKKVVNGYTIHGQDLVDQLNKYLVNGYDPKNSYIVFELHPRNSYITETDYNDKLTIYSPYEMHVYVYGNNSLTLVNTIISKFLTQMTRLDLQNQGIYLENIDNVQNGTDFINESLYPRVDFDINLYCEMDVSQETSGEIRQLSGAINLIKEDN